MDAVARRFLVSGRVQGVNFRRSTRLHAEHLGLCGFARNLSDGSVEVVVQGDVAAVEDLRRWLSHGPAQARVEAVRETDAGATAALKIPAGFAVL
jgi:acylphosphatase